MRIVIYGITGYSGGNIARELLARGHEVVGVARHPDAGSVPDGVEVVPGTVFDAAQAGELATGSDAIVIAVNPLTDDGALVDAIPGLLEAASAAGARLGIVGGAASLRRGPDGPLVLESIPAEWLPSVRALIDVLEHLRASDTDVDWFFLSPAEQYGAYAPGERRGSYRTGTDELVVEEATGRSHIGGEDYAIAFVDELERPAHHRMRFTVGY